MSLSSSAKLSKDPSGFTSCSLWGGSSSPERSTALLQDATSPESVFQVESTSKHNGSKAFGADPFLQLFHLPP